jgi:GT2 family glycosyltransferase
VDLVVNIATSGRPDLLKRTLESLSACQLPPNYRETVVVENGPRSSADAVVSAVRPDLRARYMYVSTGNKSASLNAALSTLDDCLIFLTDDDVKFAPQALSAYADAAKSAGRGHFFGGPTSADYDVPPPKWLLDYLPWSAKGWESSGSSDMSGPDTGQMRYLGFNWAAFAADLRDAGGFNPNFGPGSPSGSTGQETEMQVRLVKKGLKTVYVPEARVWHYVPVDRCSPQWVISRSYRHGLQEGLMSPREHAGFWIFPPWWAARNYLKSIARDWRWSLARRPDKRFNAKNRRSFDCGLMVGLARNVAKRGSK